MTYTLTVRDHVMIAHSLSGDVFGPAQRLHGATFVVDAAFRAAELDANGVVVDIGRAGDLLRGILSSLAYRNLDEDPRFAGVNTTTERLCEFVARQLATAAREGELTSDAGRLDAVALTLHESHIASATCEVPL